MLNVAIIGIGNIALNYDSNKNDNTKSLSHIKSIYKHQQFNLKYIIDIDDTNLSKVKTFFPNVIFDTDYKKLITKKDINILVISTPTNSHFKILDSFKDNTNIDIFFMEKPLFNTKEEYNNITNNIKDKIVVNYLRRFDKSINNLKIKIKNNLLKYPQKIIINYCKGLQNNGSHMIDLLNYLFVNNKIVSSSILNRSKGFNENDLNYDIYLIIEYNNYEIPVYFISHNHTQYNLIEFNIYFQNMLVEYNNTKSNIRYTKIENDKNFKIYKVFSSNFKEEKVDNLFMLYNAYEKLFNIIKNKDKNISSFSNEIKNKNFIQTILNKGVQCPN